MFSLLSQFNYLCFLFSQTFFCIIDKSHRHPSYVHWRIAEMKGVMYQPEYRRGTGKWKDKGHVWEWEGDFTDLPGTKFLCERKPKEQKGDGLYTNYNLVKSSSPESFNLSKSKQTTGNWVIKNMSVIGKEINIAWLFRRTSPPLSYPPVIVLDRQNHSQG